MGLEGPQSGALGAPRYGTVIVHIFPPEEHEYYGLERLWSKAAQIVRIV